MNYRTDLAQRLFGLKPGDSETSIKMAHAVGAAVLDDILSEAKKTRKKLGPGFWVFTAHDKGAIWESAVGLKAQIDLADAANDHDMLETFRRLLTTFEGLENNQILIALADTNGLRAYVVDADNPAMQLEAVLRDAAKS